MEMGILGLPQSGKSTLFEIMTGVKSGTLHNETVVRGLAAVPDVRFNKLVETYKPVKVSPAKILDTTKTEDAILPDHFKRVPKNV